LFTHDTFLNYQENATLDWGKKKEKFPKPAERKGGNVANSILGRGPCFGEKGAGRFFCYREKSFFFSEKESTIAHQMNGGGKKLRPPPLSQDTIRKKSRSASKESGFRQGGERRDK